LASFQPMLGDGTRRGAVCAFSEGGAARVVIAAGSGGRFHAWGALAPAMALDLLGRGRCGL
jgi:hypothetical protein